MIISFSSSLTYASNEQYPILERHTSYYNPTNRYVLAKGDQKHYHQQYADTYFLRLAKLKSAVEHIAEEAWTGFEVKKTPLGSLRAEKVDLRILDSRGNGASRRSRLRCPPGRALLGGRYYLYGYAFEAQYSR